jgi:cell shape-determining protein MreC
MTDINEELRRENETLRRENMLLKELLNIQEDKKGKSKSGSKVKKEKKKYTKEID